MGAVFNSGSSAAAINEAAAAEEAEEERRREEAMDALRRHSISEGRAQQAPETGIVDSAVDCAIDRISDTTIAFAVAAEVHRRAWFAGTEPSAPPAVLATGPNHGSPSKNAPSAPRVPSAAGPAVLASTFALASVSATLPSDEPHVADAIAEAKERARANMDAKAAVAMKEAEPAQAAEAARAAEAAETAEAANAAEVAMAVEVAETAKATEAAKMMELARAAEAVGAADLAKLEEAPKVAESAEAAEVAEAAEAEETAKATEAAETAKATEAAETVFSIQQMQSIGAALSPSSDGTLTLHFRYRMLDEDTSELTTVTSSHSTRLLMEGPDDELDGSGNGIRARATTADARLDATSSRDSRISVDGQSSARKNSMHLKMPNLLISAHPGSLLPNSQHRPASARFRRRRYYHRSRTLRSTLASTQMTTSLSATRRLERCKWLDHPLGARLPIGPSSCWSRRD